MFDWFSRFPMVLDGSRNQGLCMVLWFSPLKGEPLEPLDGEVSKRGYGNAPALSLTGPQSVRIIGGQV